MVLPDLPREALETLNPSLNAWDDPAFQHYVGYRQLLEEQTEAASLIVYDKSLLDAVAYWDVLSGMAARSGPPNYQWRDMTLYS